jgi:triacylglycerol esterase/lipase EstA (alpha/beta hydrolase family)
VAARLWRSVFGLALLFALIAAAALAFAADLSLVATLLVALAILCAEPMVAILLSVLLARSVPGEDAVACGLGRALRCWLSESVHFGWAVLAMSADPRPRSLVGGSERPVLLIHGILCNRAVWSALQARLRAAGFTSVMAVNLEPPWADLEQLAASVQRELLALYRRSQGARVAIVAHSMGGLIARVLLRNLGPEFISGIVTLASPHHGTRLASGLGCPATRQMARSSTWLRDLNAAQEGRFTVPVVSIYSLEDNLLAPADTARLEGAKLHELRGLGHLALLRARPSLDAVLAALGGGAGP